MPTRFVVKYDFRRGSRMYVDRFPKRALKAVGGGVGGGGGGSGAMLPRESFQILTPQCPLSGVSSSFRILASSILLGKSLAT